MPLGVVIVTYNAADVILDCLESLLACEGAELRIVVVDNASQDATLATIEGWARGDLAWDGAGKPFRPRPPAPVALTEGAPGGGGGIGLIRLPDNRGFAGGVNAGLAALMAQPEIDLFWILNPDCVAENATAAHLLARAAQAGDFAVIGGRVFYAQPALMIQSEGGRVDLSSGTCIPFNLGATGRDTPPPPEAALDYIAGSHMLVSRRFVERAGLMPEDYFLYYEEVDWCLRRGDLPLLLCPQAAVHHLAGSAIGSATLASGPSPLSAYFMARSRMKFVARWRPLALPWAWAYATAKALRFLLRGQRATGRAMLRALFGLGPSRAILARIGRERLPA